MPTPRAVRVRRIATDEFAMPPTIEAAEVDGFSLRALRAVMSGKGDQVVDLAKTSLLKR